VYPSCFGLSLSIRKTRICKGNRYHRVVAGALQVPRAYRPAALDDVAERIEEDGIFGEKSSDLADPLGVAQLEIPFGADTGRTGSAGARAGGTANTSVSGQGRSALPEAPAADTEPAKPRPRRNTATILAATFCPSSFRLYRPCRPTG